MVGFKFALSSTIESFSTRGVVRPSFSPNGVLEYFRPEMAQCMLLSSFQILKTETINVQFIVLGTSNSRASREYNRQRLYKNYIAFLIDVTGARVY